MARKTWSDVDAYFTDRLALSDPTMEAALRANAAAGLPAIDVSPAQGKFLHLIALLCRARRILEIGTLGGYSSLWLARALPPGGRLITLEASARHAKVARANFERAGLADRIDIRLGPALDTLPALAAEGGDPFDFVFIDADKANNAAYFDWALKLSRSGAIIIVDNVVRDGAVADPASRDPSVLGVRRFFDRLAAEPRVSATALQTVGVKGWDGLAISVVV
jgi:predicted O-methyltransferase YrrM